MERSWKRIISPVDDSDSSWSTEDSEIRYSPATWKRYLMSKRSKKPNEDGQGTSSNRTQVFSPSIPSSLAYPNPTDVLMHHDYVGTSNASNMTVTPIPIPYEDPSQLRNLDNTQSSRTTPHRVRKTVSYYRNRSLTMYTHNPDAVVPRYSFSRNANRVNDSMALNCSPHPLGDMDWSILNAGPSHFSMSNRNYEEPEDLSTFTEDIAPSPYANMRPLEPSPSSNGVTFITPLSASASRIASSLPTVLPPPIDVSDLDNNQHTDPLSEDSIVDLTPECREECDPSNASKPGNSSLPDQQTENSKKNDLSKMETFNGSSSSNNNEDSSQKATELEKQQEQENLNEMLLGLLECPVCLEVMAPPVHQCRRGHLLCALCRSRLSTCPTCRTSFTSCRNLAMEKVAEKLKYPCKNSASGCSIFVVLREKREHEANCPHRLYTCMSSYCAPNWSCKLPFLLTHYESLHPHMLLEGPNHVLNVTYDFYRKPASLDWILSAFSQLFRVNIQLIPTGELYGCVQYIGPKNISRKYIYQLKTELPHDTFRRIIFERTTHCDQTKVEKNYDVNDAFFLSVNWTKQFLSESRIPRNHRKLEISVNVRPA